MEDHNKRRCAIGSGGRGHRKRDPCSSVTARKSRHVSYRGDAVLLVIIDGFGAETDKEAEMPHVLRGC